VLKTFFNVVQSINSRTGIFWQNKGHMVLAVNDLHTSVSEGSDSVPTPRSPEMSADYNTQRKRNQSKHNYLVTAFKDDKKCI
jgi:hypothetical protein